MNKNDGICIQTQGKTMSKSKQRTHRQTDTPRVEESEESGDQTLATLDPTETLEHNAEIEMLRNQNARLQAALTDAAKYIEELEQMLSTSNMPGGSETPLIISPTKEQVAEVTGIPQPPKQPNVYRGSELGEQTRNVVDVRDPRPHKLKNITLYDGNVYEVEFINGRAKVPQHVADYIQKENPGNSMRTE